MVARVRQLDHRGYKYSIRGPTATVISSNTHTLKSPCILSFVLTKLDGDFLVYMLLAITVAVVIPTLFRIIILCYYLFALFVCVYLVSCHITTYMSRSTLASIPYIITNFQSYVTSIPASSSSYIVLTSHYSVVIGLKALHDLLEM